MNKFSRIRILIVSLTLLFVMAATLLSQAEVLEFEHLTLEDGLSNLRVDAIEQDFMGYMWFGTSSGVVRYNGREMVVYNTEDGLADNTILDIHQDSAGILYLATSQGISMIRNDSVTDNILQGISFSKIFVDSDDTKWFLGDDGIHTIDKDNRQTYLNETFPALPKNIYSMAEDSENQNKYFASSDGVYLFAQKDNTLVAVEVKTRSY